MKAPDIEFVRPSLRGVMWWAAVCSVVLLTAFAGVYSWHYSQETQLKTSIEEMEHQVQSLTPVKTESTPGAKPTWFKEAEASLNQDWNQLFGRLENLSVQGVRVVSIQAGLSPRTVRVEFELDGWSRVPELNAALNPAEQEERWELMLVSPAAGSGMVSGSVKAVWAR